MKKIKRMFDRTLLIYSVVGVLNFIVCTLLMFMLYNQLHVSEHLAPAINYVLGSVIWYLSCRYLIFRDRRSTPDLILRFVVEVVVCYGLSYYVIAPLVGALILQWERVLSFFSFGGVAKIEGNCAMTVGMLTYAILNYFGQRYFVFSRRFERKKQRK